MDETWHEWTPVTPGEKEQPSTLESSPRRSWDFLHPAERVIHELHAVLLINIDRAGILLVTNFRLLFVLNEQICALGSIPFGTIDRITKPPTVRTSRGRGSQHRLLQIFGRDVRIISFGFQLHVKARNAVIQAIQAHAKPKTVSDLYAFASEWSRGCGMEPDPRTRLVKEFNRIISKHQHYWTVSDVNSNYSLCSTYPPVLVMPKSLSKEEIQQGVDFRGRGRLPTLSWQHPGTGAVLARSSQPLIGIMMNSRSIADEKLVGALCGCGPSKFRLQQRKLYIVDARPRKNALANGALGGGSESSANYSQSEVVFLGIDNIHVMRESLARLRDYLDVHGAASSDGSSSLLRGGGATWGVGNLTSSATAVSAFGETAWLTHNHNLLAGSAWIAARIAQGSSVLVHCSDGWDRTTQLVTLVQILLDPFYRTFDGLQALIEKDWLAFGHPFAERLGAGHFDIWSTSSESSPIFLQCMDCLSHILRLYPREFEYSMAYLVDLVDAVLSRRFANFLCNSEKEREQHRGGACIWTYFRRIYLRQGRFHKYRNMFYKPTLCELVPPLATLAPSIWPDYYLRWSEPRRIGQTVDEEIHEEIRNMFCQVSCSEEEQNRAEDKVQRLTGIIKELNGKLKSVEQARSLAVAEAARAHKRTESIKHAVETMGCDISFDEKEVQDGASPHMAISVAIKPGVDMSAKQRWRGGGDGKAWPQNESQRLESAMDGLYVDYEALERVSMDDRYFHSSGVT